MYNIFINFRNADDASAATMIDRDLSTRFGSERIFRDSKSIKAGADFAGAILSAIHECQVMIAVIGPRWLTARGADGRNALDDEEDWIRRELLAAKEHGVRVIPILVGQITPKPDRSELPPELAWLADVQYRRINNREADGDLVALAAELQDLVPGLEDRTRVVEGPTGATHVITVTGNSGPVHAGNGNQFNGRMDYVAGREETP
jgi:hypothetical protein